MTFIRRWQFNSFNDGLEGPYYEDHLRDLEKGVLKN